MKPSITPPELLSALADGQLGDDEFDEALQACALDASVLGNWNTYHLIGEVLRAPASATALIAADADLSFVDRLNLRLAGEVREERDLGGAPASLAAVSPFAVSPQAVPEGVHHRGPASNDSSFRWKLVAGVASLAAVSAIAWNATALLSPAPLAELAQASAPQIVVTSPQGPMVRDVRLEELLAAHRQFGGTSALQESSGFLRNATFEMRQDAQTSGGR